MDEINDKSFLVDSIWLDSWENEPAADFILFHSTFHSNDLVSIKQDNKHNKGALLTT